MKINEITDAASALSLWKIISDNTWAAINYQAEQEAKQKAEKAAKTAKRKPRKSSASSAKRTSIKPVSVPVVPVKVDPAPAKNPTGKVQQEPSAKKSVQSIGSVGALPSSTRNASTCPY